MTWQDHTDNGDSRYLLFHERLSRFNQNKIKRNKNQLSDELMTIGLHRSAISDNHAHVDGQPAAQHPLVRVRVCVCVYGCVCV